MVIGNCILSFLLLSLTHTHSRTYTQTRAHNLYVPLTGLVCFFFNHVYKELTSPTAILPHTQFSQVCCHRSPLHRFCYVLFTHTHQVLFRWGHTQTLNRQNEQEVCPIACVQKAERLRGWLCMSAL